MNDKEKYELIMWAVNNFDKVVEQVREGEYVLEAKTRKQLAWVISELLDLEIEFGDDYSPK